VVKLEQSNSLLLALGGNISGRWGEPGATIARAIRVLSNSGVAVACCSNLYRTQPVGVVRQPTYLNAVVLAHAALAPAELLRLLKIIERRAGRRLAPPMHPRPLDIDILDHGGRRLGWPPRRRERGRLILPHPHMHERAFVLVPLLEVAPLWRHPVLGVSARTLLARLAPGTRSGVRQALDLAPGACEKGRN
jgi:2-amino-4-hydroxy-6-hydroxymethyldihydropteridine diphosphokinase